MISIVVLAAGFGRRFATAEDKRCALVAGKPLLVKTLEIYQGLADRRLVVLRPEDKPLQALAEALGFEVLRNPQAQDGLSRSVRLAITQTPGSHWLIALGDMPFIQRVTIENLLSRLASQPLVAPFYCPVPNNLTMDWSKRGHPVGFQKVFQSALLRLSGDVGAGRWLQQPAWRAALTPFFTDDYGILQDIDKKEDILSYQHSS